MDQRVDSTVRTSFLLVEGLDELFQLVLNLPHFFCNTVTTWINTEHMDQN